LTTYYTTAAKISSFLGLTDGAGLRKVFTVNTLPTSTEVDQFINNAEDEIDEELNHAWRSTSIATEYYDYDGSGMLHLKSWPVQGAFASGTDKVECWNGSTWYDLVANKTEGRGDDYWVDYDHGVIYFLAYAPLVGKRSIRVTYVHGESSVPGWVERLCNLLVAIHLASTDDYSILFPEGTDNVPLSTKVQEWKKEVQESYRDKSYSAFR
jgi:hypothetical protein